MSYYSSHRNTLKILFVKKLKMIHHTQNIFIVEDNYEHATNLHQIIEKKFGKKYPIFTFSNAVQALIKVDEHTILLILKEYYMGDEGSKIINFIKNINPKTKVLLLSKTEDFLQTIELYKQEISNQLLKNQGFRKKLKASFFEKMCYPAQYLQQRYSVSQEFVYTVFLFIAISILVFIGLQLF